MAPPGHDVMPAVGRSRMADMSRDWIEIILDDDISLHNSEPSLIPWRTGNHERQDHFAVVRRLVVVARQVSRRPGLVGEFRVRRFHAVQPWSISSKIRRSASRVPGVLKLPSQPNRGLGRRSPLA